MKKTKQQAMKTLSILARQMEREARASQCSLVLAYGDGISPIGDDGNYTVCAHPADLYLSIYLLLTTAGMTEKESAPILKTLMEAVMRTAEKL